MNAYQPRTKPRHGYDSSYSSFQSAGMSIFGYDASANWLTTFNLEASRGAGANFRQFTGKERDSESGLDYFGARHYGSALGRFTSTDPLSGTVLHILNPQRWNMYAYAVNNPLVYVDPDGRDAIAVGFSKLASGLGHAAVISVHKDGTAEYGDFGPATPGSPVDAGKYNVFGLKTKIDFDSTGLPTQQSLAAVTKELAGTENQPETSITLAYFKTSDLDTAALDAFLKAAADRQAQGKSPRYYVGFRDCIWFCASGMQRAGQLNGGPSITALPNLTIDMFAMEADASYDGATGKRKKPKEDVRSTFKPCASGDSSPGCSK